MSATVEIRISRGTTAGSCFSLSPGDRILVGRADDCAITIPDHKLSRQHFELVYDGSECKFRDLGSTNGTILNGQPAAGGMLTDGDELRAGGSLFLVRIRSAPSELDALTPTPAAGSERSLGRAPTAGNSPSLIASLLGFRDPLDTGRPPTEPLVELFASTQPLESVSDGGDEPDSLPHRLGRLLEPDETTRGFAVVDAARAVDLALVARLTGNKVYSLFTKRVAPRLAGSGPCLVELCCPNQFLVEWVARVGQCPGVLLSAKPDLTALGNRLRTLFVATDGQQQSFFRFYDPDVLRPVLVSQDNREARALFNTASAWVIADCAHEGFRIYRRTGNGIETAPLNP